MISDDSFLRDFDGLVYKKLCELGIDFSQECLTLCAGVSGGADSVCLLVCLSRLSEKYGFSLKVLSVNHKIRSDEETDSDVEFVEKLCGELKSAGTNVEFECAVLPRGLVSETERERNCGIEEAARHLRYKAFREFAFRHGSDYFCVAHNKNDQEETLLMRFLQGSRTALYGICEQRDIFYRPLIEFSRGEIERYLEIQGISWRTDRTNLETEYLRNKIRLKLIPLLDENFKGWEKAVVSRGKGFLSDEDFIQREAGKFNVSFLENDGDGAVLFDPFSFCDLHEAVQIRVVYRIFDMLKAGRRLSLNYAEEFAKTVGKCVCQAALQKLNIYNTRDYNFSFELKNGVLNVKKTRDVATENGFFAIIDETGVYDFPFGKLTATEENGQVNFCLTCGSVSFSAAGEKFPFCVRSVQPGDLVRMKDGNCKKVLDVFSDWHVPVSQKNLIPLVQELSFPSQEIKYMAGSLYGFPDWILRS